MDTDEHRLELANIRVHQCLSVVILFSFEIIGGFIEIFQKNHTFLTSINDSLHL